MRAKSRAAWLRSLALNRLDCPCGFAVIQELDSDACASDIR